MTDTEQLQCVACGTALDGWAGNFQSVVAGVVFKPICRVCQTTPETTIPALEEKAKVFYQLERARQKDDARHRQLAELQRRIALETALQEQESRRQARITAQREAAARQAEKRASEVQQVQQAIATGTDPLVALPSRVRNCLKYSQVTSVEQIASMSDEELLSLRNLGTTALALIRAAIPYAPTGAPVRLGRVGRLQRYLNARWVRAA